MFSYTKKLSIYNKIIIFSDIHIGLEGDYKRENQFFDYIDSIKDQYEYIIFNGDTFECLRYSKTHWKHISQHSKLKRIIECFPRIIKYLQDTKFIFIFGNHDYILKNVAKDLDFISTNIIEYAYNERLDLIIKHGHQIEYDNDILEDSLKSKWYMTLLDYIVSKLYPLFNFNKRISGDKYINNILFTVNSTDEIVEEYIRKFNYKNIIFGHTHNFSYKKIGDINYYNTGSCLRKIQGIEVDCDGKFNLIEVEYDQ